MGTTLQLQARRLVEGAKESIAHPIDQSCFFHMSILRMVQLCLKQEHVHCKQADTRTSACRGLLSIVI